MTDQKMDVSFDWNEEFKVGMLWVGGTSYQYPGYDNERQARIAAGQRLGELRRNFGPSIPRLPPRSK